MAVALLALDVGHVRTGDRLWLWGEERRWSMHSPYELGVLGRVVGSLLASMGRRARGRAERPGGHPRVHPGLRYPDNPDYTTLSPYISMIQTPCQHRGRFAVPNAHHRGARRHPEATKLPSADANSCALCTRRKVKCSKVSRSRVKPRLRRQTIPCTGCLERGQGALCQRETVSVKGRIIK